MSKIRLSKSGNGKIYIPCTQCGGPASRGSMYCQPCIGQMPVLGACNCAVPHPGLSCGGAPAYSRGWTYFSSIPGLLGSAFTDAFTPAVFPGALQAFSAWLQSAAHDWYRKRPGTQLPDLPDDLLLRAAQFHWHQAGMTRYARWLDRVQRFPVSPAAPVEVSDEEARPTFPATTGMGGFTEAGEPAEWDTAMGTVRGYRQWSVMYSDNGPHLTGSHGGVWLPHGTVRHPDAPELSDPAQGDDGRYRAVCGDGSPHEVPAEGCGCGFWAYWEPFVFPAWSAHLVVGVIEGSGRVLAGEHGFRCEYARILGLSLADVYVGRESSAPDRLVKELAAAVYGVPFFSSQDMLALEFGADPNYGTMTARYPELGRHDRATLLLYISVLKAIEATWLLSPGREFTDEMERVGKLIREKA